VDDIASIRTMGSLAACHRFSTVDEGRVACGRAHAGFLLRRTLWLDLPRIYKLLTMRTSVITRRGRGGAMERRS